MSRIVGFRARLRALLGRAAAEERMNEEIRFHIEMEAERLVGEGIEPGEAMRRARLAFGPAETHRETLREGRRLGFVEDLHHDLRFAARALRRSPAFTVAAVATLGLGIGANAALFGIVDAVLLRELPYRDADRLVVAGLSAPEFRDLRERDRSFDAAALWASNQYTLRAPGEPEQILGAIVSADFFPVLGLPALGRTFRPDEARTPVAVISHDLWMRRFGGDPAALGRTVVLGKEAFTVIGVAAPRFRYPQGFDVWLPMEHAMLAAPEQLENRSLRIFRMVARLRPGSTLGSAQADLRAIATELARLDPEGGDPVVPELDRLYERLVGEVRTPLLVLLGAVGLVLLIACVNVANLLLARMAARSREIAARRALGAGRGRLVRQLLTESALLAAIGAALGIGLGAAALRALPAIASDLPRLAEVTLGGRVLAFTAAVTAATVLLVGLLPAVQGAGAPVSEVLREGGRGVSGGRRSLRLRAGLVVAQVALAVAILIGAALLVQSLARMLGEDRGFRTENLLAGNVALFHYEDPAERALALREVIRRVALLPGVSAVGAGTGLPPQSAQRGTGFEVAGRAPGDAEAAGAYFLAVSPGYFAAMGTGLLRGREFADGDGPAGEPVAIVNQALAERLFPDTDPIGRQIRLDNPDHAPVWRTIVGVVATVRYDGLEEQAAPALYTPFDQTPFPWSYLMVRTAVPPAALARGVRETIESVSPDIAPAAMRPLDEIVAEVVAPRRFPMLLLGGFALLALLLASIGIYGVVAFSVAQRTREMGIRIALGAAPATLLRGVLRQGMRLVATGLAGGVLAALWLTRLLEGMLYQVRATEPVPYLAVTVLLGSVALLATWLPARRAAHVDPAVALRAD